jgi:hypothetical protein
MFILKTTKPIFLQLCCSEPLSWDHHIRGLEYRWNVMAHGDAREGNRRGKWRMEWVASTLRTTSELGLSGITTADAHNSAASSRLNWRPRRFKWTRPFRREKKSGFCACAITFQTQSTKELWRHVILIMPVGVVTTLMAGRKTNRRSIPRIASNSFRSVRTWFEFQPICDVIDSKRYLSESNMAEE